MIGINFPLIVGNMQHCAIVMQGKREYGSVAKIADYVEQTVPLYSLDDFRYVINYNVVLLL
jgi:hypothetical protein